MNKKRIDEYLPRAIEALSICDIANGESIINSYRGQISSFGAAITMGSFKAAVAYLAAESKDENSQISKARLLEAIYYVISEEKTKKQAREICKMIFNEKDIDSIKDKCIDASIALKLAMNAYKLVKEDRK